MPSAGSRLHGGFNQGWLTFECTTPNCPAPLRRLCPIPQEWESLPESRLELLSQTAEEVIRSNRPRHTESEASER